MKLNDIFSWVKNQCKDDETCIMIVFIVVGFMLCWLFKDQISGYANFSSLDDAFNVAEQEVVGDIKVVENKLGMNGTPSQPSPIGIELKRRKPEPTPSTMKQLQVMEAKPSPQPSAMKPQMPGLQVQDSMIFKPFDEVWNPGFMPLDMVFKGIESQIGPGSMGPKPMGPDRPMGPGPMGPGPMGLKGPMPKTVGAVGAGGASGASGEIKIVLIYAPWCGHSKNMLPDFERVKSEFDGQTINGKKISIIMYNSDVDKDKVKEYGVKGFPTLFIETNGDRKPFPHRSYEKISEYLKSV